MSSDPQNSRLPVLAVVVPCYNESQALPHTLPVLLEILNSLHQLQLASEHSYILCVDDGSKDDTWQVIEKFHAINPRVKGIALAHNRGHQYALLAGLMTVRGHCEAAVTIDADLQDDPNAIIEMMHKFREGKEIIYGVRSSRQSDTAFKRNTAHAFYSFQKAMGLETVYDHADYRLMSNRAIDLLSEYGESNMFLRGIVPLIGLENDIVTYERKQRVAGVSKYPLTKMLSFSIDGITSFSAQPMRWIFITGLVIFLLTILVGLYVLVSHFFIHHTSPGWTSLMLSIWGLGSLILMAIGIVGEYIGKIFTEVKNRPRFAVKDKLWD
ncbi:MAG: glycosyltransferase family 2 protein [Muribaculaceae bacterium]|nr:glycosyltransferase family 2 protein [Muribaculaceae bacterium]